MDHLIRLALYIKILFLVDQQGLNPSPTQTTKTLLYLLFPRANRILALFRLEETTDK